MNPKTDKLLQQAGKFRELQRVKQSVTQLELLSQESQDSLYQAPCAQYDGENALTVKKPDDGADKFFINSSLR